MSAPTQPQAPFAAPVPVARHREGLAPEHLDDWVAVEEPLEIRLNDEPFAVVMRTPGHDLELAAGHLLTEGVVRQRADIAAITPCRVGNEEAENVIKVSLGARPSKPAATRRHGAIGSSCGTCGKRSIEQVHLNFAPLADGLPRVSADLVQRLPQALATQQNVFRSTGGLHGVALFCRDGTLLKVREDVGRHNAVDKVLGFALLNGLLPLHDYILFVSGRISFEIVQKALAAQVPTVAGISAPTSLAVDFARASGQTLVGFVREGRANVYAGNLL